MKSSPAPSATGTFYKPWAPWAAFLLALVLVGGICLFCLDAILRESEYKSQIALNSSSARRMQSVADILFKAQAALFTLSDLVSVSDGEPANFDAFAAHLLSEHPDVGGLFLAPDGVVSRAVPLAGNEAAMGHNLLKDPARKREVEEAIARQTTVLAGPVNMKQGGVGLFARKPVFLHSDGKLQFWGLVVAMIYWDTIKDALRLDELSAEGYAFELTRTIGEGSDPIMISRSDEPVDADSAATRSLDIPGGTWTLRLSHSRIAALPWRAAGSTIILLFSLAAAFAVKNLAQSRITIAAQARHLSKANADLERMLGERDVLIKEIHHRVKNNLQVIVAILELQGMNTDAPQFAGLVAACKAKIKAISLAHEQIYQGGNLARVDVRAYLDALCASTLKSFDISESAVRCVIDAGDHKAPLNTAILIGLIVTELITNSLKHAFHDTRDPEVRVQLQVTDNGDAELTVADNGRGFDEESSPTGSATLGLSLVEGLASQLDGSMRRGNDGGARVNIGFPLR